MRYSIESLSDVMAAEVVGLDLSEPLGGETVAQLQQGFLEHLLLCFRGEPLEPEHYLRSARYFGTPKVQFVEQFRHPEHPEIFVLANNIENAVRDVHGDGKTFNSGTYWHTDDSYLAIPCSVTILHAHQVPSDGGATRYCNMYRVYEEMPEEMKRRVAGIRAIHRYHSRRSGAKVPILSENESGQAPEVSHPIVRTHPFTGKPALYINPNRIERIEGLSDGESDALLDELYAFAFQDRFQYHHQWQRGDLVMWDNRCLIHAATADYTEPRLLHRILLEGTIPA